MPLQLDYYHGNEAEQYSFYRIPKALFTDKHYQSVSVEAKMLYGLMLDRMGLSFRNKWMDQAGRVYIYFTLEEAITMTGCSKNKVIRFFKELDGIGLIERKKQGQGKPARIYVKNFILPITPDASEETPPDTPDTPTAAPEPERLTSYPQTSQTGGLETQSKNGGSKAVIRPKTQTIQRENSAPEDQTSDMQTSEKVNSAPPENQTSSPENSRLPPAGIQNFLYRDPNKTDKKKTDRSETDPSIPLPFHGGSPERMMDEMDSYRTLVMDNIEYGALLEEHPEDSGLLAGYLELIVETICSNQPVIHVCGDDKPADVVRSRLLKLTKVHIVYVLECMKQVTTPISNIKAYTLAALYNAPATIRQYQAAHRQAEVPHEPRQRGYENIYNRGLASSMSDAELLQYIQQYRTVLGEGDDAE